MAVIRHVEGMGTGNKVRLQSVQQSVEKSTTSTVGGATPTPLPSTAPEKNGQPVDLSVPHDIRAKQDQLARLHEQSR